MAVAFDSLGYSRHLRDRGVPQEHAEAMADAARTYIMQELATKGDLLAARGELKAEIVQTRTDLEHLIETQTLRITIRMGAMIAAAVAILGTLQRLV